jgi:FkbM family methyltransferase
MLWITGLHAQGRALYRVLGGAAKAKARDAMLSFYRQLVPAEAVVFDIGANVGVLADIFSTLGAKVVALEPNTDCLRHIQLSYPRHNLETIQAVAGPKNGLATLNLSDQRDDISSVSNDWISAIQQQHSEYRGLWSRQVAVPMLTLDTLIEHYGMPHFIKIDVEGFEESVLDGLSQQPKLLSFEFNLAFLQPALRCLYKKFIAEGSVFNYAMGDPTTFELKEWVGKEHLKDLLSAMEKRDRHGDIFVKAPAG